MHPQLHVSRTLIALAAAGLACGGSSTGYGTTPSTPTTPTTTTTGFYIRIFNMAFSPLDLAVPPGGTVTVLNADGIGHSVTSEVRAGMFTPGSVAGVSFDTGIFIGTATFAIPRTAAEGTVIPYYCRNHMSTMATPTGTITVRASAQPAPAPTTSGGTTGGGGMGGGY